MSSWFVEKGATAPLAAGKIHSSFESKFICVDVCKVDDWVKYEDEDLIRDAKKMLKHGRDYIM